MPPSTPRLSALITGASRGIGRAIALRLAKDYHIIALARTRSELDSLRNEITASGGTVRVVAVDLRDPAAVAKSLAGTSCEVLINNAGVMHKKPFVDLTPDEWHAMIDVNLNSIFHVTRVVLPGMIARGAGHIINISSITSRTALVGGAAYAATKHAVLGLSESLMLEVRDHGVRVSLVTPGSVATELIEGGSASAWALRPSDVADCVASVLATPPHALLFNVEVRASRPVKKQPNP
jgi:3-hydroxy acid dehydrogenase / malonic semialdehyde reductase